MSELSSYSDEVGDRRRHFVDRLQQVCEEVVGPNAASVDAAARHPIESWAALHAIGGLSLRVPVEHGGLWIDDLTYIDTIAAIAKYCAATAMTIHMHSVASELIAVLGTSEQRAKYFPLTVDSGGLFGSWGSEPGFSASLKMSFETVVLRKDDHLVVNGQKYFCTMAGAAAGAMVLMANGGDGDSEVPQEFVHVFVPANRPGATVIGEWNPMGMRGTVSPGTRFEDCVLEQDALFRGALTSGVLERLSLGFSAIMLGIAEAALAATSAYLSRKRYVGQEATLAHEPTVQRHIGEIAAMLYSARLVVVDAGRQWTTGKKHLLGARAKYVATKAALAAVNDCIQVIGGNAATKTLTLERNYRDIRTCSLMPPNVDRMQQVIGSDHLGIQAELFQNNHPER